MMRRKSEDSFGKTNNKAHYEVIDKKAKERKRNLLYLIDQYLKDEGYFETSESLQLEAHLTTQYSVCDNIDLPTVLQEYESYFYLRYQKHPKVCKLLEKPTRNELAALKDCRSARQKNRLKKSESKDPKPDDIADLMNIQSYNKETDAPSEPPAFKESAAPASIFKAPELLELSENITREIVTTDLDVKWEHVIGLDKAKQALQETLIFPLQHPHLFQGILSPWKSVLLYGPPGTGKTMLAKALASEGKFTFFNITATSVVSKWRGESEKLMRVLFETAKHKAPSVIFLDEFEALACRSTDDHEGSKRLRAEFLMQFDGLSSSTAEQVFVLAITNSPWSLQTSILRRFEKRIFVDLPNEEDREVIIRQLLPEDGSTNLNCYIDYKSIAQLTDGYSGSDLKTMCREAAMSVLRQSLTKTDSNIAKAGKLKVLNVTTKDVEKAISMTKPTTSAKQNVYKEWEKSHGSG
ncbi:katanin p60 ATPase-containing subunit A-like 2 [Neocloeon triangulifer]|uniref:katanin p60 ATPase-containing subunit A-like 2 n=1 Tax=Neocloeon triangulifer TaxID=2078957 RepID=UPI00286F9181|nr:katanin p60 ATPase-containing subunit A-like 2 [Neocloeon triangulifer]